MSDRIAKNWRIFSGQDRWEDLLDPLDIDLRRYILHYGEMAEATYDTFNFEYKSKYAGSSIYVKDELFESVGLEKGHPYKYKATKYFYATSKLPVPDAFILKSLSRESWCRESNFMGFIAVATDEGVVALGRRDIVIAWRGSVQALEWFEDLNFVPTSGAPLFGAAADTKIQSGWLSIYTSADPKSKFNIFSAREQIVKELKLLLETYKDEEVSITVTGHSLGAALAVLNAVDIAANGFNAAPSEPERQCPVTAFVFGCPYVGDAKFLKLFERLQHVRVLKIHNVTDIVPLYPFVGYSKVGQELLIDTRKSPYLKQPGIGFESRHNLEAAYLHGVAGTQGLDGGFKLEVNRSLALANKFSNFVKEEYLIPTFWWNLRNKGMVQNDDGSWVLEDHARIDDDEDE